VLCTTSSLKWLIAYNCRYIWWSRNTHLKFICDFKYFFDDFDFKYLLRYPTLAVRQSTMLRQQQQQHASVTRTSYRFKLRLTLFKVIIHLDKKFIDIISHTQSMCYHSPLCDPSSDPNLDINSGPKCPAPGRPWPNAMLCLWNVQSLHQGRPFCHIPVTTRTPCPVRCRTSLKVYEANKPAAKQSDAERIASCLYYTLINWYISEYFAVVLHNCIDDSCSVNTQLTWGRV